MEVEATLTRKRPLCRHYLECLNIVAAIPIIQGTKGGEHDFDCRKCDRYELRPMSRETRGLGSSLDRINYRDI